MTDNQCQHIDLKTGNQCANEKTHIFVRRLPDSNGKISVTGPVKEVKLCNQHYQEWKMKDITK